MVLALSDSKLLEAEGFRLDLMLVSQGVKDLEMLGRSRKGGKRTATMDKIRIKTSLEEFDIHWPAIRKVFLELAPGGLPWDETRKEFVSSNIPSKSSRKLNLEETETPVTLKDAYKANTKVEVKTNDNQTQKYDRIEFEDGNLGRTK